VDKSLSTELSASKYYIRGYAQESVDKVGQNPWITQSVAGWRSVAEAPLGRLGGGDCGGTKHLQKKFFKKTFEVVDIKRKKHFTIAIPQTTPS
jgi:hypothetical protein